jgi:hypothetical protein
MKNRHERRKEKKLAAHEIVHVSYMVFPTEDGPKILLVCGSRGHGPKYC